MQEGCTCINEKTSIFKVICRFIRDSKEYEMLRGDYYEQIYKR